MMNVGAKVTVTLEVDALGSWGVGCSLEQIEKQATEEAVRRVRKLVERNAKILDTVVEVILIRDIGRKGGL